MKNIVILGIAYGGARAAVLLSKDLPEGWRVIAIDRNTHFNRESVCLCAALILLTRSKRKTSMCFLALRCSRNCRTERQPSYLTETSSTRCQQPHRPKSQPHPPCILPPLHQRTHKYLRRTHISSCNLK